MAEKFTLKIISPDASFYEGECEFLEFTTVQGQIGIYARHIPLTCILAPCAMRIHDGGEVKKAAVMGGFAEILKHQVTVLAEGAQWPEDIDLERARQARERAKSRLESGGSEVDETRAREALKRAEARIEAKG